MCLNKKDIYATFTIKTTVKFIVVIIDLPSNKNIRSGFLWTKKQ